MPPLKSGKTLSAAEIGKLKTWIEEGAEYETHWAFLPPAPAGPAAGQKCRLVPLRRSTGSFWRGSRPRGWRLRPRPTR